MIDKKTLKDIIIEELEDILEKKKKKRDACYHKVKSRYKVWPSAYASGALVKCRKVGAKNWGKKVTKEETRDTYGSEVVDRNKKSLEKSLALGEEKEGLRKWFKRKGEKGSKGGWVDCNAPDGKGGYKECAQGERKKKPACRPTPARCKDPGKGTKWGKKMKKEELEKIIKEELNILLEEQAYYEMLSEGEIIEEAEYQGRKVTLNKPMKGDVKKSKVYVKNDKGNVVKVNFGDPNMKIRKSNPKARKSFRARHNCKNPGPKWKARYWSCKAW